MKDKLRNKPSIAFVGAGALASGIGRAAREHGYTIDEIVVRKKRARAWASLRAGPPEAPQRPIPPRSIGSGSAKRLQDAFVSLRRLGIGIEPCERLIGLR